MEYVRMYVASTVAVVEEQVVVGDVLKTGLSHGPDLWTVLPDSAEAPSAFYGFCSHVLEGDEERRIHALLVFRNVNTGRNLFRKLACCFEHDILTSCRSSAVTHWRRWQKNEEPVVVGVVPSDTDTDEPI